MTVVNESIPKVVLVYFNAGGGHRAAAVALKSAIEEQGFPWTVELVDLFAVLDPAQQFTRITGMAPEAYYNMRLSKGWTIGLAQELKLLQAMIRLGHGKLVSVLHAYWRHCKPDLVASLIPNFNLALGESLDGARPGTPFVTVLTDLADHPPNFWIEPGLAQHVVCGTERAQQQALEMGIPESRIHRTSGMILRPDFYRENVASREEASTELGLEPGRPTGLVLFGGHGSMQILHIAKQLRDLQLVLLCGHNRILADRLRRSSIDAQAIHVVVGFTSDVRRFMQVSDYFIGKPGPGSISEALQQGLPIVTVRNRWTMPQERYNTDWILEHGLGVVGASMRNLRPDVQRLLNDLDAFRRRVAQSRNRAVFEVPRILERILRGAGNSRGDGEALAPDDAIGSPLRRAPSSSYVKTGLPVDGTVTVRPTEAA